MQLTQATQFSGESQRVFSKSKNTKLDGVRKYPYSKIFYCFKIEIALHSATTLKDVVTLGNLSCILSRNFVVPFRHKLQ